MSDPVRQEQNISKRKLIRSAKNSPNKAQKMEGADQIPSSLIEEDPLVDIGFEWIKFWQLMTSAWDFKASRASIK